MLCFPHTSHFFPCTSFPMLLTSYVFHYFPQTSFPMLLYETMLFIDYLMVSSCLPSSSIYEVLGSPHVTLVSISSTLLGRAYIDSGADPIPSCCYPWTSRLVHCLAQLHKLCRCLVQLHPVADRRSKLPYSTSRLKRLPGRLASCA